MKELLKTIPKYKVNNIWLLVHCIEGENTFISCKLYIVQPDNVISLVYKMWNKILKKISKSCCGITDYSNIPASWNPTFSGSWDPWEFYRIWWGTGVKRAHGNWGASLCKTSLQFSLYILFNTVSNTVLVAWQLMHSTDCKAFSCSEHGTYFQLQEDNAVPSLFCFLVRKEYFGFQNNVRFFLKKIIQYYAIGPKLL